MCCCVHYNSEVRCSCHHTTLLQAETVPYWETLTRSCRCIQRESTGNNDLWMDRKESETETVQGTTEQSEKAKLAEKKQLTGGEL